MATASKRSRRRPAASRKTAASRSPKRRTKSAAAKAAKRAPAKAGVATNAKARPARKKTTRAPAVKTAAKKVARKTVKATNLGAAKKAPRKKTARHALVVAAPSRDNPHWTDTLADGTHVLIRPIHKEDAALERAFIKRLSPESRRLRFLGQMSEPSEDLLGRLTDLDYRHDLAFVALVHREGEKREIGVARYSTNEDGTVCECAVTVGDEWRNKGLGSLLMRHLIDVARSRGIRSMISLDAADNNAMRDLASFLGFRRRADPDDPTQVIHTLDLS